MRQLSLKRRKHALSRGEHGTSFVLRPSIVPEGLLIVCAGMMVWFCRRLLAEAEDHDVDLATLLPLFLATLGMMLVALLHVLGQVSRSARRLAGPLHRITVAMQRTRNGDVGHRVHLRRSDALKEVAAEYNRVLDWLNENPPLGVKTGSDVIEVEKGHEHEHDDSLDQAHTEFFQHESAGWLDDERD